MASNEKRRILLALAPLLLLPPPTIQVPQLLLQETGAVDETVIVGTAAITTLDVAKSRAQPPRPQQGGYRITVQYLQELPDTEALWAFRYVLLVFQFCDFRLTTCDSSMTGRDLLHLVEILHLPNEISTPTKFCFNRVEAFALSCARLASAGDKFSLSARYNRSQSVISEIFNEVITFLDEHWGHLLHFDSDQLLSPANLKRYSEAIFDSGAPMRHVWGFIDCTVRPMCHPLIDSYSGMP